MDYELEGVKATGRTQETWNEAEEKTVVPNN